MLKLTERETFTIIGYLEMDSEPNKMLTIKLLTYAQNEGWYRSVKQFIQDQQVKKRDIPDLVYKLSDKL